MRLETPSRQRGAGVRLETPSRWREAFTPAPSGKARGPLGRGLGHPPAQPRRPAASMGPAPYRRIGRIPAGPRSRGSAPGSPKRPRCAPPAGDTHLRRRRCLPVCAGFGPRQTQARASPSATTRGAGPGPASGQSGAAARRSRPIRSTPRRPAPGDPKETFQRDPCSSQHLPRAAGRWTFPPLLSRGGLYHRKAAEGGAAAGAGPISGKEGGQRPMGSWGPLTTCCWLSVRVGCPGW